MATRKQRAAGRKNIKKAAKAAKQKQTLKHLPKKARRALGKQAAKVRRSRRRVRSCPSMIFERCRREEARR